jgi:glycosyltransferase involved in cell wall biosynthesis
MDKYNLPLISVIIPIYNCEAYLKNCLDSIAKQTLQDYELILINDSSTDSTQIIIDEFKQENKQLNIKCYANDHNKGEGYSRNLGIKVSQGEFLCFCDADDEYDIQFLEYLYNAIIDSKDLVYCGFDIFDTINNDFISYEKKWKYIINSNDIITSYLQLKLHFSHVSAMYRKSFLVEKNILYNELCPYGTDIEFVCNILISAPQCGCVPKNLYYYKIRENSISTTLDAVKIISPFYALTRVYQKMTSRNMRLKFLFGRYSSVAYYTIKDSYTHQIKLVLHSWIRFKLLILSVVYIFRKKHFFKLCTYKQLHYWIFQ